MINPDKITWEVLRYATMRKVRWISIETILKNIYGHRVFYEMDQRDWLRIQIKILTLIEEDRFITSRYDKVGILEIRRTYYRDFHKDIS